MDVDIECFMISFMTNDVRLLLLCIIHEIGKYRLLIKFARPVMICGYIGIQTR